MIDVRCKGCGRLLAKATVMIAAIKCPHSNCKQIYEYHIYENTLQSNFNYDKKVTEAHDAHPIKG